MKITCRYSGHVITQDNALLFPDFAEINLAAEHPIFSASNKVLLSQKMLSPWYQGTMSEEAKKLLFLAVALNNNLIEFEPCVVAAPTVKTVESCFFPMLRIVSWLQDMNSAKVTPSIPRYKISRETASMDNFRAYLQNVETARRERIDNENKEEFEHKWEASINKIVSNINAGMVSAERSLNIALAKWAMSVTPVPNKRKELWSKLLVMTDKQLISQPSDEISALHDFMEWELPHGSIAAARVMKRCREMLEVSTNLLGHLDNSFFIVSNEELDATPSTSDGKVQIGTQKYSPKVQEAMRKHAERVAALRASVNKPVTSSVIVPHNRRAEDRIMNLDDDSTEGEVTI